MKPVPGRFFVQKFLRDAVRAKCDYAVIEMTSEGARQFRHKFIDFDALIFLNLSPEHIESHGSYEKYVPPFKPVYLIAAAILFYVCPAFAQNEGIGTFSDLVGQALQTSAEPTPAPKVTMT